MFHICSCVGKRQLAQEILPRRIPARTTMQYQRSMSLTCLFRRHRPMLSSIMRRETGYTALCDRCGLPIERTDDGRWTASEPLLSKRERVA